MVDTIILGDGKTMNRPTRPMTSLPARLDAEACLKVLEQIHPDFRTESISAARESVDILSLDSALEYTELSIESRMKLKFALVQHRVLARGRKLN